MLRDGSVRIGALSPHHDRQDFSCGVDALDSYLMRLATQDLRRRVSRVFVATGDDPSRILGYYTLSAAAIEREDMPAELALRLPRYPVPAALIGRLAVDLRTKGQGLGKALLADAIGRTQNASKEIAICVIVVDAKNESARSFYEQFGFRPLGEHVRRLFLPLARIGSAL